MTETQKENEYPEFHGIHSGKYYDRTQEVNYKEKCEKMNKKTNNIKNNKHKAQHHSYEMREKILDVLRKEEACRKAFLSRELNREPATIHYHLKILLEENKIEKKGFLYSLKNYQDPSEKKEESIIPEPKKKSLTPKKGTDKTSLCVHASICKYRERELCNPHICKYYRIKNKKKVKKTGQ